MAKQITMYDKIVQAIQVDQTECIYTPTGLDRYGYGQVRRNYKMWKVHKLVYTLTKGDVQPGSVIRHTCDNRACINPKHLVTGTHQDNMDDMKLRKRAAVESNVHAKLNWEKVDYIRASKLSPSTLAVLFKVQKKQIIRILRREQWQ